MGLSDWASLCTFGFKDMLICQWPILDLSPRDVLLSIAEQAHVPHVTYMFEHNHLCGLSLSSDVTRLNQVKSVGT